MVDWFSLRERHGEVNRDLRRLHNLFDLCMNDNDNVVRKFVR